MYKRASSLSTGINILTENLVTVVLFTAAFCGKGLSSFCKKEGRKGWVGSAIHGVGRINPWNAQSNR